MAPSTLESSGNAAGTRTSQGTSNLSNSEYTPSVYSDEHYFLDDRKSGKPRWLNHVKSWLSVSEPSAQAMKDQKRFMYKKHGVEPKDPRAAAKMHFPIGKLPEGITTSTSGPDPEKVFKQRNKERQSRPYTGHSRATPSISSGISSIPSVKETNPATPWDS